MTYRATTRILMGFLSFLFSATVAFSQSHPPYHVERDPNTPFRYVIVKGVSEIEKLVADNTQVETMIVLMEDRAFNKRNLVTLFKLLKTRYPDKFLSVNVFTTLDAILTPEEADRLVMYGAIDTYRKYKYAFYNLNGYGERFLYGLPRRKETEVWISSEEEIKAKYKY